MYYEPIIKKSEDESNKITSYIDNLNENKLSLRKNKNARKILRKRKYKEDHLKFNNEISKEFQFQISGFDLSFNIIISYLNSNNPDLISYCLREISIYFNSNFPNINEQKTIIEQKFLNRLLSLGNNFMEKNNINDLSNILNILINIASFEEGNKNYLNELYTNNYFDFFNNCIIFAENSNLKFLSLIITKICTILTSMFKLDEKDDSFNILILNSKVFPRILEYHENQNITDLESIELIIELVIYTIEFENEEFEFSGNDIKILHKCLNVLIKELYSTSNEKLLYLIYRGISRLSILDDEYKLNKKIINEGVTIKILKMKFNKDKYTNDYYNILKYAMLILANNLTASDKDCQIIYSQNIIDYYNNILEQFDDEQTIVKNIFSGLSNIAVGSERNVLKESIIWQEKKILKYLSYSHYIKIYFIKIVKYLLYNSDFEIIKFIFNTRILEYFIFLFASGNEENLILNKIIKIIDYYLSIFKKDLKETKEYLIIYHKFKELLESSEIIILIDQKSKLYKSISKVEKKIESNYE